MEEGPSFIKGWGKWKDTPPPASTEFGSGTLETTMYQCVNGDCPLRQKWKGRGCIMFAGDVKTDCPPGQTQNLSPIKNY